MRLQRLLPKIRDITEWKQPFLPRDFKEGRSDALIIRFVPKLACFPISAPSKLAVTHHPCHLVLKDRYEKRREPFLWYMITSKEISGKQGTIRNWITRRVRVAFTKALQDLGYRRDGTRIPQANDNDDDGARILKGTASITLQSGIFDATPDELHAHSLRALRAIIQQVQSSSRINNNNISTKRWRRKP